MPPSPPLPPLRWVLFDWGDTLMSEDGPAELPMALWPELRVLDGAAATLAALARRYRLGVATNASVSDRTMVARALDRAALGQHFESLFCYRDLGVKKHEPAYWAAVLDRLGVAPAEVAMVGDNFADDVAAPRRAGLRAIWFNWKGAAPPADGAAAPATTIATLGELVPLLL